MYRCIPNTCGGVCVNFTRARTQSHTRTRNYSGACSARSHKSRKSVPGAYGQAVAIDVLVIRGAAVIEGRTSAATRTPDQCHPENLTQGKKCFTGDATWAAECTVNVADILAPPRALCPGANQHPPELAPVLMPRPRPEDFALFYIPLDVRVDETVRPNWVKGH